MVRAFRNPVAGARFAVVMLLSAGVAGIASAQPDPSGIDLVTIGSPGNLPWPGDGTAGDRAIGRGSVAYEYRIGKYEVTTSEWTEFFNAAFDRPQSEWIPHVAPPLVWGATSTTPTTPGGLRWNVPAGNEMRLTGSITWRTAAVYCNWLCNGKSLDRSAFLNGAYDVSTFGYTGEFGDIFTDQFTHNPGAQYWIPTWDEWLKAAHFDPNKDGPGLGGWWKYSNSSNTPLTYGPPGIGQANAGWDEDDFPGFSPSAILLGAYAPVASPWGLFDVAGGTNEWTEEIFFVTDGRRYRIFDGTGWDFPVTNASRSLDWIGAEGGDFPSLPILQYGFRVASAVPAPGSCVLGVGALVLFHARRRRSTSCSSDSSWSRPSRPS